MKKEFATMSVTDISESLDYPILKNYIVSNITGNNKDICLEYPIAIDGTVFLLCLRGSARFRINMEEHFIEKNVLLTILPGSVCETIEHNDDLLFEYLFFSIDFTYGLNVPNDVSILEKMALSPVLRLTDEQFGYLLDFHSFIIKQYKRENHMYRELLAKNLLASFLTELCHIYNDSEKNEFKVTSRKKELFQQFGKLLMEHIKTERSVQFYADKMCLSPKYLSHLIKEISGKSIMKWISYITIIDIKAMLKTSNLTILQISEELNFPNASFFGSYFKKYTGMSPLQYRES
jgi:AraC-like DNA-binding protein